MDRFLLREGISWRSDSAETLVFPDGDAPPVRVSDNVTSLLPLLARGCTMDELLELLPAQLDRDFRERQVVLLIDNLRQYGIVDDGTGRRLSAVRWLFDVGALAQRWGLPHRRRAIAVGGMALVAAALAAIAAAAASGNFDNPLRAALDARWAVFVIALLMIPIHETGHVVAAIASGTPLGRVGVRRSRLPVVRPFVETIPRTGKQTAISAAGGPIADLVSAGLACAATAAWPTAAPYTASVATLALFLCFRNLNPAPKKDGANILAGLGAAGVSWLADRPGEPSSRKLRMMLILAHFVLFLAIVALLIIDLL